MTDYAAARRMMVDGQVRTADVTDRRLSAAMLELPRERFLPESKAALAYLDRDVVVSESGSPVRCLLKPMVLAKLLQTAEVLGTDRVLDVGCATGYSAALLSRLAGSVIGVEEDAGLARQAAHLLADLRCSNARVVTGPLARGFPAEAPYDLIVLEGAAEIVPQDLIDQIKEGGRLVGVVGSGPATKAMLFRKVAGEASARSIFDATAPTLSGFVKPPAFVF